MKDLSELVSEQHTNERYSERKWALIESNPWHLYEDAYPKIFQKYKLLNE